MSTQIVTTTNSPIAVAPFTVNDRILLKKGVKRGVATVMHLEEVRDHLRKLATLQSPVDHERSLDQLHVNFTGGRLTAQLLTPDGLDPEVMLFSTNGAQQVAKEVLPSHFYRGLRDLAGLDNQGAKLATLAWAKFAADKVKVRRIRTVLMKDVDRTVRRMIRSCHSQDYSSYTNLQFVEDLLQAGKDFTNMPVLDVTISDSVMRLRFAGDEVELKKPVRMYEAWNSEVGRRRVGLRGGMFKLVCTNGMGHWSDAQEFNWRHYGDAERIRSGVASALKNLEVSASQVLQAYQQAANVNIDNAYRWLEEELRRSGMNNDRIDAAKAAINHETTTPGNNLASCVDAITLIAQDEEDVLMQDELERMAADLLQRALAKAAKSDNMLFAEA